MNFSVSSSELLTAVALLILAILAIIFAGKAYFSRISKGGLPEKYKEKKWTSPLTARNKYPEVDVFKKSSLFLRLGLIAALVLIIAAFNWTTFEKQAGFETISYTLEVDVEIEPPRSSEPPPPPPPPPPPVIQEIPEGVVIEEEEQIEFVDQSVDAETSIDAPAPVREKREAAPPPPPPPPPPDEADVKEIFKVVEEMPRFPGCEDLGSVAEKKACADRKLTEFIYKNIQYPVVARENGIEGTVVIRFVVDVDGKVNNIEVLRDIGAGCGDEAKRIVELMNEMPDRWTPGRQRGRAVRVMFTMPVKFKLEYN